MRVSLYQCTQLAVSYSTSAATVQLAVLAVFDQLGLVKPDSRFLQGVGP